MMVSTASRMVSAISLGVFCRSAPSTRAIIRSTKDWPGLVVIRTTIRSDSTVVPPVTAERSPPGFPDHRGGLAGDGRLVHRGDALDHITVAGDHFAGLDHDLVPDSQLDAGHPFLGAVRAQAAGDRFGFGPP